MNELFNVTTNGDKLTLSARELHKELNIAGRFSRWFEQMSEYGFEENVDFTSVQNCTVVNNGAMRELQDYQITLDMAKEIAMLQRNEKGKQIRKKLIELEKAWNSPEKVMARALDIAHKTIANLQIENEEMKPKAFFADAVKASDSSILIGDLAKLIKQNGYDIGEKKLYRWLREKGYICKNSTEPTQMAMNLGLFEIVVRTIERGDAPPKATRTTKVTGKGQVYFINKLCNSNCSLYDLEPLF
ncbi:MULTISPECIES: phage antirepressor KilAC domain-containing protein [unclassified Holdemanella]|uniref:phage antirepressor KilAC domain-containing protein n=1 Tax=unclassified Holdemanella TaxID=2633909 RepID=UPI001D09DD54|nr:MULTISPECIES: phage antirepressor KilAC domain-containing protein [unclassified Holdemanella]MCB8641343.1 phage antirepressor KilAC domain-containing protein [Holdemanella sp. DFI.5.55]MCG5649623.1 phage antirepressor KilAC domain-containing protein [Holdemanella sp. DFI.5.21]